MKPFDLSRALAGEKIISRTGFNAKIVYQSEKNLALLCVYEFDNHDQVFWVDKSGRKFPNENDNNDLFMAPKVKTYWINVYRYTEDSGVALGEILNSEKECIKRQDEDSDNSFFVKRISFEIEE